MYMKWLSLNIDVAKLSKAIKGYSIHDIQNAIDINTKIAALLDDEGYNIPTFDLINEALINTFCPECGGEGKKLVEDELTDCTVCKVTDLSE